MGGHRRAVARARVSPSIAQDLGRAIQDSIVQPDFEGFALPSKLLHSMKSRRIVPPRAFGGLRSATLTCVAIPRELKSLKDSIAAFFI